VPYRAQVRTASPIAIGFASMLLACGLAAAPPVQATTQSALTLLNSLPVSPEHAGGYDRRLFKHWIRQDGCTTRQDVLIRDRIAGRVTGCAVADGRWYSAYDGVTTATARSFDIDHEVPLKEAWDSGAWRWTPDRRTAYANDLGYGNALIAVSAASNRSKGDQDPADWMPPNLADTCRYAKAWVGVKYRWRLSVDTTEKAAISRTLRDCALAMELPELATA
jgi:hypothetical protein